MNTETHRSVFPSAYAVPGRGRYDYLHQSSDDELLKMVTDMTGADSGFIGERFGDTILRTLRNYGAVTGCSCLPGMTIPCPIYAYAAADDTAISYESVLAWSDFTTSEFAVRVLPGDHFYPTKNVRELVEDIECRIDYHGNGL